MFVSPNRLAPIPFIASQQIRDAIAGMGRTEDVRFSPDGRQLAVAGYFRNRISVFRTHVHRSAQGPHIELTQLVHIESTSLIHPHGVDFIDDRHIVVSNRRGGLEIFAVPERNEEISTVSEAAVLSVAAEANGLLKAPGSVRVSRSELGRADLLVCNNQGDTLTRHLLDTGKQLRWIEQGTKLAKWLDLPDGLALSEDGRWLAVSSHEGHIVLVYDLSAGLDVESDPVGILRGVFAPHGLAFSADGNRLIVADADTPYLHVYAADATGWCGVRFPLASLQAMDVATYERGHYAPGEGGVKGVSFCGHTGILATTCHHQPLACFDLESICANAPVPAEVEPAVEETSLLHERRKEEMRYELLIMARLTDAKAYTQDILDSVSWRLTRPLRDSKRLVEGLRQKMIPRRG